jgi:hypothetical protein
VSAPTPVTPAMLAALRLPCLLCTAPMASYVGIFFPTARAQTLLEQQAHAKPVSGQSTRTAIYALCGPCAAKPDYARRVEIILLGEDRLPDDVGATLP